MGVLNGAKKVFAAPYKAVENKFIPIVNSTNNYLDKWFPQDKWNWRKVAVLWAGLQAIIIGALELYVAIKYKSLLTKVYKYYSENNANEAITTKLSLADPLSVYHMIFLVALFYQYYLICDTVAKSSTLQLIAVSLYSFALAIYSVVQFTQANTNYRSEIFTKYLKSEQSTDPLNRATKIFEFLIIVLSFIFSFGWIIVSLRLYKVFGWNVFKQLGADIGVKNRLKLYQIFLTLLKIDFFFFVSFAMQFLIFIIAFIKHNDLVKYINICLIVIVLFMPIIGFAATKKENYRLMTLFIVFLSISIGYMTYSLVDILVDIKVSKEKCQPGVICMERRYRDCEKSLLLACVSALLISFLTFVLALVNFKNFPKGLKKDKSIHQSTSQNSTISTSYNTPKRWSIE
ncbi:hypothetical protein BCR32DRAFT_287956 [Anaeromyces robustus]|uniref:Uncharacterized protein n=1 Tax=Anaeromyces robustus TaxID=1754192 RepID=A0A1Y1VPI1_9FUNG|nr:hypothetical protein BCR32DRAFT_287956 [Anaeromyces robustus]|eukprot:ORX62511.1 hypothetical protein BCR32DRAFT_287956 [Anaeromyces robustus]